MFATDERSLPEWLGQPAVLPGHSLVDGALESAFGLGYWKGPEFRIWARPASRNRIFNEIIQKAGRETLTGGIKRPVSGSSETIKYRW